MILVLYCVHDNCSTRKSYANGCNTRERTIMSSMSEHPSPAVLQAAEIFKDGKKTRIKLLNGIEVDLLATVHELPPNATIEGDVPDTVQVVVASGGLTVNGFVGGNIIAEGSIVINGNATGGWIISSKGDIHVKGALANSRLISKSGQIHAERLEGPACVFAWKGVNVSGEIRGGRVYGSTIGVGKHVESAQLHSVGAITAARFATSARGDTIICLRETLSCEDYGRPMSDEERKLHRSIGKLRYQIDVSRRLVRYATHEMYDSYKTYLYTMLCGNLNAQKIRVLRGLQCQANFLGEVTTTAKAFTNFFQKYIALGRDPSSDEAHALAASALHTIHTVSNDMDTMATAFRLSHKGVITAACGNLNALARRLDHNELPVGSFATAKADLAGGMAKWQELLDTLNEEIRVHVGTFGLAPGVAKSVEARPEKAKPMLEKIVGELKKDPNSARYQRMKSPLIRLIQTSIDRNAKNIVNWQRQLQESRQSLAEVKDTLSANATTMFADDGRGLTFAEAPYFDAGVVIASNPAPKSDPMMTAAMTMRLGEAIETDVVFELNDGQIARKLKRSGEIAEGE